MRTSAFDYRKTTWDTENVSGLQKRVSILLGLDKSKTRPLSTAFEDAGVELLSSERLAERHGAAAEGELVADQAGVRRRFSEISLTGASAEGEDDETARLFSDISYLKNKAVSGPTLRQGIHLDRYRVTRSDASGPFQAIFSSQDGENWRTIGAYDSVDAAADSVNALRRFLVRLNVASEGFHIIEHILLRPLSQDTHQGSPVPAGFYPFKMSVIFPDWTARFQTPGFRRFTEEMFQDHCPAHISPEFHWLGLDRMQRFEELYKSWLSFDRDDPSAQQEFDGASKALINLLIEIGAEISK